MTTDVALAAGDRVQYTYSNGSVDRNLIVRRSARDRFCDAWDRDCEAVIRRGELHAANRYGLAHLCLVHCERHTDDR